MSTQPTLSSASSAQSIATAEAHSAHNYHPLPVVIATADGAWVTDVEGRRYLDMLAGYSALNFGHRNPRLIEAAKAQLDRATLTSRAFHNDRFADFAAQLAELCGMEMVLPMNTGAEAVETAVKTARKWGYQVKGVPDGQAKIVVADNNFHGRTTTIISFSTDEEARADYGPYTPGFEIVPYGDLAALEEAVDAHTVAVLLEPIQGEAGVLEPPPGYLAGVRELTRSRGGCCSSPTRSSPASAAPAPPSPASRRASSPTCTCWARRWAAAWCPSRPSSPPARCWASSAPANTARPFGGNPLACAVALEVLDMLRSGEYQQRAKDLGEHLHRELRELPTTAVREVRGRGLWAGVDIDPSYGTGREISERLLARGVLAKDTHGSTIRLAPPLCISREDLDWGLDQLRSVLTS